MGIVFPDLAGPYYSAVLLGAEAASVAAGSSLLILATHGRPQAAELVRELSRAGRRADRHGAHGRRRGGARAGGRACRSSCSRARPWTSIPTVRSENREPARELTEHLLEVHGHERLAFVGDPALVAGRRRPLAGVPGRASRPGCAGAARRLRGPLRRARGPRGGGRGARPAARRPRSCAPPTRSRSAPTRPSATGACAPAGHRRNRVGRHPARALRHTRLDHRPPADGRELGARRRGAARSQRVEGAARRSR